MLKTWRPSPIPVVWSPDTRLHEPAPRGLGGCADARAPRSPGRVDAILEGGRRRAAPRGTSRTTTRCSRRSTTRSCSRSSRARATPGSGGRTPSWSARTGWCPTSSRPPRCSPAWSRRRAAALHAQTGRFCYDTMTLVGPGTWEAARAAVDCALTAVDLVVAGERTAYALCRPPGHHVTPGGYGGSCYLNNAAVAAEALRAAGHERVAVIDVDAHHGNGTQAIFWERSDVLYGSLHVDPAAGLVPPRLRPRLRDRRRRRHRRHAQRAAARGDRGRAAGWTRSVP